MKSLLLGKDGELGKAELCASTPLGVLVALARSLRLTLKKILAIPATRRSTRAMR